MRRLQVARAFMCDHEILFLDEPTLGLDPQTKRKVWDCVIALLIFIDSMVSLRKIHIV